MTPRNSLIRGDSMDTRGDSQKSDTDGKKRMQRIFGLFNKNGSPNGHSSTNKSFKRLITEDEFTQNLRVEEVTKDTLKPDDIVIALMGPTGSGKSTFIETAAGVEGWSGHGLHSHTSEIQAIRIIAGASTRIVLVDTPGFDDTEKPDLEILQLISQWLKETYEKGICLSGILFLHRISDNRMAGTPLRNLEMFKKLCGQEVYGRVVLMTTMWTHVEPEIGVAREKELTERYWTELMGKGSRTFRFEDTTRKMAWNILNHLIELDLDAQAVQIQNELVDMKKALPNTKAGRELHGMIEQLVEQQKEVLARLREEVSKTSDPAVMQVLLGELMELRAKRDTAIADMRKLNPSLFNFRRYTFWKT